MEFTRSIGKMNEKDINHTSRKEATRRLVFVLFQGPLFAIHCLGPRIVDGYRFPLELDWIILSIWVSTCVQIRIKWIIEIILLAWTLVKWTA